MKWNKMKYIEVDNRVTGWTCIPGYVKTLKVFFNNGEEKEMSVIDYATLPKREKNKVVRIGYEEQFTK